MVGGRSVEADFGRWNIWRGDGGEVGVGRRVATSVVFVLSAVGETGSVGMYVLMAPLVD